jgi:ferredoxin
VKRVSIDEQRCQGHGRCALIAPEVFDVDASGAGRVVAGEVPDAGLGEVMEAVRGCPEDAIAVSA